jgi:hypothetical protein
MSDESKPLQFETAETQASGTACSACKQPIASSYFTVGGQIACERCKADVELALQRSAGSGSVMTAILLGSLAGLAGAAVWYGVRAVTDSELGIIAIAIGWGVGTAVRSASGGRGGRGYQVLAVLLTYFWIAANYVPDLVGSANQSSSEAGSEGQPAASADAERPASAPLVARIAIAMLLALALPFMMGFENVIGLLIIAFGLYQAWQMNQRVAIAVEGPFSLAQGAAAGG